MTQAAVRASAAQALGELGNSDAFSVLDHLAARQCDIHVMKGRLRRVGHDERPSGVCIAAELRTPRNAVRSAARGPARSGAPEPDSLPAPVASWSQPFTRHLMIRTSLFSRQPNKSPALGAFKGAGARVEYLGAGSTAAIPARRRQADSSRVISEAMTNYSKGSRKQPNVR